MRITSDELNSVRQWLQARLRSCPCHCCEANAWAVSEIVVLHTDDLCNEIAGQAPALVEVVCQDCAQVMFFDLARIKNLSRRDKAASPATSPSVNHYCKETQPLALHK